MNKIQTKLTAALANQILVNKSWAKSALGVTAARIDLAVARGELAPALIVKGGSGYRSVFWQSDLEALVKPLGKPTAKASRSVVVKPKKKTKKKAAKRASVR